MNGDLEHAEVTLGCDQILWWQCQGCPHCGRVHMWQAPVARVARTGTTRSMGCPSCAAVGRPGFPPCVCRSVASNPQLTEEWCSEGNAGLLPEEVALNSAKKCMWQCLRNPSHPHYEADPNDRNSRGTGCPECAQQDRRIRIKHGSLAEERPDLAAQWDYKVNEGTPEDVSSHSNRRVFWICPKSTCEHPHRWEAQITNRTARGAGCPFCSGLNCCPCNSLARKYPELLEEWDWDRNAAEGWDPEQIPPGSSKRVWWKNDERGSWQQKPNERVLTQRSRQRRKVSGHCPPAHSAAR